MIKIPLNNLLKQRMIPLKDQETTFFTGNLNMKLITKLKAFAINLIFN